ncbi:MAG: sigma 54-dependent transcriptional regulator, partial [Candidatus Riflebacteria bacterium]|nr:sigma 54-dependent transcriptional regulator [Candidatus Riflebacteria bacterium]
MKKVVIGFLGTVLDRRGKDKRWESWRPSVAVCQHEDLLIDRFHLLCSKRDESLARQVAADIEMISPETEVLAEYLEFKNPWDFEEVFSGLLSYSQNFDFREDEEYLMHITTGTHVTQICVFLLTEAGFFPARLLQTGPGRHNQPPGSYEIIDLDLS